MTIAVIFQTVDESWVCDEPIEVIVIPRIGESVNVAIFPHPPDVREVRDVLHRMQPGYVHVIVTKGVLRKRAKR